jgi:hypothetical protein
MPGAISVSARTVLSGGVFSASAGRPADPSGATTGGTSTGRDVVAKPGTDGIVGVHLGEYRSTSTRQGVRRRQAVLVKFWLLLPDQPLQ